MGWLSGYSYRMSIPVMNQSAANKRIIAKMPAWFLKYKTKAKSDYSDIHVTTADGTTELPCGIDANGQNITIDYANMPTGRSVIYVYYGNPTATAPQGATMAAYSYATPVTRGIQFDLVANMSNSTNTGAHKNADADKQTWCDVSSSNNDFTLNGVAYSTSSGWSDQDGASAALVLDGADDYARLTNAPTSWPALTLEAWFKFDSIPNDYNQPIIHKAYTSQVAPYYQFMIAARGSADLGANGKQKINFHIVANGTRYEGTTSTGYFSAGDLAHVILTVDPSTGDAKVYYNGSLAQTFPAFIPVGSTLTNYSTPIDLGRYTNLTTAEYYSSIRIYSARVYNAALNQTEVTTSYNYGCYGVTNITILPQVFDANDEVISESDINHRYYLWGDNIETTYLSSTNNGTYYGGDATHKVGVTSLGEKCHYLLKYFEGALPIGTANEANLYLYASNIAGVSANTELRIHRLKTTTADAGSYAYRDTVKTGWSLQASGYPTWNNRMYDYQFTAVSTWLTAGATNASEIDSTEYSSLNIVSAGVTTGYKVASLNAGWINDWISFSKFSQGILIKDSLDTSADRYLIVDASNQVNSPVLEVNFSSLADNQFLQRKLTTDTYCYATFSSHNRYMCNPDTNQFAVMVWTNAEQKVGVALIDVSGRIRRIVVNTIASGKLMSANGMYGVEYDSATNRYWMVGSDSSGNCIIAYSEPHDPSSWTWVPTITTIYKASFIVKNDTCHIITMLATYDLGYYSYTRGGTLSAATNLHNVAFSGTQRGLAAQLLNTTPMNGDGVLDANGSIADYPAKGCLFIGGTTGEYFIYTGKSGNSFTGVTRSCYNSTPRTHAASATISFDYQALTYVAIVDDPSNNRFHVGYTVQSNSNGTASKFSYNGVFYLRHYYSTSGGKLIGSTDWYDNADTHLTLPLNQKTASVVTSDAPAYFGGIGKINGKIVLSTIFVPQANVQNPPTTQTNLFMNNSALDLKVSILDPSSGTWTQEDCQNMTGVSFIASSDGQKLFLLGLDTNQTKKQFITRYGVNDFSGVNIVSDYTGLPDAKGTYLWQAGNFYDDNFGGKTIQYTMHQAQHGALFLDSIILASVGLSSGNGVLFGNNF